MSARWLILVTVFVVLTIKDGACNLHCAYMNKVLAKENGAVVVQENISLAGAALQSHMQPPDGTLLDNNKTIRCPEQCNYCFSYWQRDCSTQNGIIMLKQGCWSIKDKEECDSAACVAKQVRKNDAPSCSKKETFFCCCYGDMCNINTTVTEVLPTPKMSVIMDTRYRQRTIIIALALIFTVGFVIVISYLALRLYLGSKQELELESSQPLDPPPTPTFQLDDLKLSQAISRGRFGEVWKGTLNDLDIVAKVFTLGQCQHYVNEREIYMLPCMEHESLLHFYGAEERLTVDGVVQYLIVLSYCPIGTLMDYLKHNTINWQLMCRMCLTMSRGLAHLHSDIRHGEKSKPTIAHRDLNSRNVLVRNDLGLCIADFGFAMKLAGSHFYKNGHEENAEQTALTDVGTLRYMAPEVLEGAVNLRDCEASLKQIDVYSLGLIFWEISSRCTDLYQGMPVPEYQLPFQAEVGTHPSFDEMQLLVSRNKARPLFPEVWKANNQAVRALRETIEDCWDQDADARLTVLCVEERVVDMASLWETRHKGVTPTVNPTVPRDFFNDKSDSTTAETGTRQLPADGVTGPLVNLTSANSTTESAQAGKRLSRFSQGESSTSASTVATMLTMSPSESLSESLVTVATMQPAAVSAKENINANYAKTKCMMQPHQGQNPTVERNTHKCSDEELAVLGNTLVDKSTAAAAAKSKTTSQPITDELLVAIADNLESSLVQNDLLSQPQMAPHNPITYTVQNCVHGMPATQHVVRPKQPNVPSNGLGEGADAPKPKSLFAKLRKSSKGFFSNGRHGNSSQLVANGCSSNGGAETQLAELQQNGHVRSRSDGESNLDRKSNLNVQPVPTEVRLVSGGAVVRPTSLSLVGSGDSERTAASDNRHIGDAKPQQMEMLPSGRVVPMRRKAHSHVDLSPSSLLLQTSASDISQKIQRPASLSLCGGHQYSAENVDPSKPNCAQRKNAANGNVRPTNGVLHRNEEKNGCNTGCEHMDVRR